MMLDAIQNLLNLLITELYDPIYNAFINNQLMNNVLNLISTRLNDIESMFIISHHADTLEIPYDCEMVIIKDQYGISKVK